MGGRAAAPRVPGSGRSRRAAFATIWRRCGARILLSIRRLRRQLAPRSRRNSRPSRATGLPLDHVNATSIFICIRSIASRLDIGTRYGMRALRVPVEPWRMLSPRSSSKRNGSRPYCRPPGRARLRRKVARRPPADDRRCFRLGVVGRDDRSAPSRIIRAIADGEQRKFICIRRRRMSLTAPCRAIAMPMNSPHCAMTGASPPCGDKSFSLGGYADAPR